MNAHMTRRESRPVAGTSARVLGGHLPHAAHVVADCGESPAGAQPEDQSLVGSSALCEFSWINHFADPVPGRSLRDPVRFLPTQAHDPNQPCHQPNSRVGARSVADFIASSCRRWRRSASRSKIWKMPCEIPDPIPFDQDTQHASYDAEYAHRFWRILVWCDAVFKQFRAAFIGKASPVHFFWGSFDLAVTRFSGRRAPEREGADPITREAYSHEVISAGFWPGGGDIEGQRFTPTPHLNRQGSGSIRPVRPRLFIIRR